MNSGRSTIGSLPTPEAIADWRRECAKIDEQIQSLTERKDAFHKMIAACETLGAYVTSAPEVARSSTTKGSPQRDSTGKKIVEQNPPRGRQLSTKSWTATLARILHDAARGLTYEELKEQVRKSHLGQRFKASDKGFYGAIGKLADKDQVVRHNGRLYDPGIHRKFMSDVAAGRAIDEPAPQGPNKSPLGDAMIEWVESRRGGATSSEIIEEMKRRREFSEAILRNKTFAYNVLSRLVDRGDLTKGGGRYYRAPDRRAAA